MFYNYLLNRYGQNNPIFISDLTYKKMTTNNIRQQIMNYLAAGKLKRYATGIYYIPGNTIFKSGSMLSPSIVIEKKYLSAGKNQFGYTSGLNFANEIGISTQVPMSYEVVTNKASKDYREIKLASSKIIIKKPRLKVTKSNYKKLQLLDLFKDIDLYVELNKKNLWSKIKAYMEKAEIKFSDLEPFLPLYPDKTYRNMYMIGVLGGVST